MRCAASAPSCTTDAAAAAHPALRVLLASANERDGGAAVAARRLRDGLRAAGTDALLFVQTPGAHDPSTIAPAGALQRTLARARSGIDALPLRRYPGRHAPFSVNWLPRFLPRWPDERPADVVHLHWIHAGFMSLGDMAALRAPIVWTLHDMWALTGGCHYDEGCGRHASGCGRCPILHSTRDADLSAHRWRAKRRTFAGLGLTLVAPSHWLADAVRHSPLLDGHRVEVIPNGIDLARFKPLDRRFAREALGLPADARIVLFGAVDASTDPRKGHDLLQAAMQRLAARWSGDELVLVVFGSAPPRQESRFGLRMLHVGVLVDEPSLALLYAAADVFVAPSRQDNLPNTVVEALACGTPCVGFHIGGLPDLVEHQACGWLAPPFDTDDLAHGIAWTLDRSRWPLLAQQARRRAVERFDMREQVRRTVELYREVSVPVEARA